MLKLEEANQELKDQIYRLRVKESKMKRSIKKKRMERMQRERKPCRPNAQCCQIRLNQETVTSMKT